MDHKIVIIYEIFKTLSFWLIGVWLLIGFAPIILPILMIAEYMENR